MVMNHHDDNDFDTDESNNDDDDYYLNPKVFYQIWEPFPLKIQHSVRKLNSHKSFVLHWMLLSDFDAIKVLRQHIVFAFCIFFYLHFVFVFCICICILCLCLYLKPILGMLSF